MKSSANRYVVLVAMALGAILLLGTPRPVWAFGGIRDAWVDMYPASSSYLNASCLLCHGRNTSELNAYGNDIRMELNGVPFADAIAAVEDLDSDGEGSSNIAEINASSQPGWTEGANNSIYDTAGNVIDTDTAPDSVEGDLDPPGNQPPVVDPGGPYFGVPGEPVQFDASNTFDPDGDELLFLWDFGDMSLPPGEGPTPTHTYQAVGDYTATVSVWDGITDPVPGQVAVTIREVNLPPIPDAGGPYEGEVGQAVEFDGSNSTDPENDPLMYEWRFGDGNSSDPSPLPTATHTYDSPGNYVATLTVSDGINPPQTALADVEIVEVQPPEPPKGDTWEVLIPLLQDRFLVTFKKHGVLLLVKSTINEKPSYGLGVEVRNVIYWLDVKGAVFFGHINRDVGKMSGIVINYMGRHPTFWVGRRLLVD